MRASVRFLLVGLLALIAGASTAASLEAQVVRADAIAGSPFGVGILEFRVPNGLAPEQLGVKGVEIHERDGRVLYPAMNVVQTPGAVKDAFNKSDRPIMGLVGSILDSVPPTGVVLFLFEGDAPLNITLQMRRPVPVVVRPRGDQRAFGPLMQRWWNAYTREPGPLEPKEDYPPLVDNYLKAMLAHRLDMPPIEEPKKGLLDLSRLFGGDFSEQFGLAIDTQALQLKLQRERFSDPERLTRPMSEPLPAPLALALDPPTPGDSSDGAIEPLAMHAPRDFFYVRFGSFNNFLWMQDTLKTWGGDVQNLVALRGVDYRMSERVETQLALKQTALARLFGQTVINDVAFVGLDTFLQEGGSFGLLFEAKNSMLLTADFMRQRQDRAAEIEGSTLETITIDGHRVSYLETPDGRTRSYYASVDEFHLVCRSRAMVEHFLAMKSDVDSLGATAEFQEARRRFPVERDDTIFAYFSRAFLENVSSPAYRIGTVRRLEALADMQLVQLAVLAAQGEGRSHETIDDLKRGGYLPSSFGPRPDGGETILPSEGEPYDSLWGRREQLLPVADVEIGEATPSEVAEFERFRAYFEENWSNLDPVLVAIRQEKKSARQDLVTIDMQMTPLTARNYERIRGKVGAPSNRRLATVEGDIGSFEVQLNDSHLFGGLRNVGLREVDGRTGGPLQAILEELGPAGVFRELFVGYLGAEGTELGSLRWLNVGLPPLGQAGYVFAPLGGVRLEYGGFTLFSFQQEVLAAVAPNLHFVETEHPSQFRLELDDVSKAHVTPALNNMLYARTRETSRGNLRLLKQLREQLHVPPGECKQTAEDLLGGELICPLGGRYVFDQATGRWASTALVGAGEGDLFTTQAPPGFVAPPLNWFRGLDAEVRFDPSAVAAHAELLMQASK